jgi:structural maintenance of chromosome 4
VAISTACPALANIVVDTVETAQRCVEHLRKHSLGKATFIILEKLAYLQTPMTATVAPPESVSRLFDLVRPKTDALRLAFYFALRDTLVADDLEQAVRYAEI